MSIHWPIIKSLLRNARRVAVVDDNRSYRGIDLLVASQHVAGAIAGASSGDKVGLLLPTSGAFPIAALAAWTLGRTVVPLNYLLKPEELQYVVDDSGIDAVVTVGPMLEFLGGGSGPGVPKGVELIRMDAIDYKGMPELRWPRAASDEDLAVLLYTSGTSGRPKGVMLTHGNIKANITQVIGWANVSDSEVVLGVLPQFHSFGLTVLTLMPLWRGIKSVFTARFVPGKILRLFREHRPTIFVGIPAMYNALLYAKDGKPEDLASLWLAISGGEPLPRAVAEGFEKKFDVRINEGYGLTETAPATNICLPHMYRPGSVGPPIPGVLERIVDLETGADLPPGRDGEVRIAGANVMKGYYRLPVETAAAFDERRYLRTGDIGRQDADGHLYITGRLKEMIIVAGENVFPREIEEVLNAHPAVKDSGVIGVTDPMRGEVPLAFVEMADGAAFNEKELLGWCRGRIAGYKVPAEVRVIGALPRNPTGKVMRRELKKLLAAPG